MHARVEDGIRTGKDTGIGKFPSHAFALNQAWLAAALIAATLLAWLRLLALDGDLAKAEPKTLRYRILHAAARLTRSGRRAPPQDLRHLALGHRRSSPPGTGSPPCPKPPDQHEAIPAIKERNPGACGNPGHPARQPGHRHTRTINQDPLRGLAAIPSQRPVSVNDQG